MEQYEKIKVVGRGAFGTVYLCRRLHDMKLIIIKQIPVEQMTKDERQSALNEVKVLSMLDHPNIIEYYENFLEDKALMIVMEYAEGGTVFEYLQQRGNALIEEDEVLRLMAQILLSMKHVHSKQILHRDLKTQNILLNRDCDVIKIGDFGISKILSSKSKAFTVVGTPSYISPELCEGKPYNQKSDMWAIGCVLYELLTLRRAFEANNLPALVMKIMRGSVAPISDRYSDQLKRLLLRMLHLDPDKRPTIDQVMAEPIIFKAVIEVCMTMGAVKVHPKTHPILSSRPPTGNQRRSASRVSSARSSSHRSNIILESSGSGGLPKPRPLSLIYCWGNGIPSPLRLPLPHADTKVLQVSIGRSQKTGVTHNGRLIIWESPSIGTDSGLPGAVDQVVPLYIPRYLEGQSAVSIQNVSCGDLFVACLTDRGILMTFGSGAHGCLGHGNYQDLSQAKIVEALLGYEVALVSCGASHVMAVTNEHEVFSWGRGDNGRLGLDSQESVSSPQAVVLPPQHRARSVCCGVDCSMLITEEGVVIACGSNRCNKLGLDQGEQQIEEVFSLTQVATHPLPQLNITSAAIGTSHSAFITDKGECYTLGSNQFGQLGCRTETTTPRIPCKPSFPDDVTLTQVACGDMFTVAITTDDKVFSWGKGARGRIGRPLQDTSAPRQVRLVDQDINVLSVSCSHSNTIIASKYVENEA
ncbi:serine/threonine-protein kinase Nek8 [Strongylocentrotus purpuratus]|uniref:non-specific serine/threonine protein kinase n=1 Tax=Strongylocentrotus purpuratus TaxID=7668 RepID=A0A7M7PI32_STRPU|nr:serine/threonine-protein kinase Nek8 [Strongylocentrotus purpuratus]